MTDSVINLDSRRGLVAEMDAQERRFRNDADAAVDKAARKGCPLDFLDGEDITDDLMAGYGDGLGVGPEIVRSAARSFVSDLVHAAIEKRRRR